MKKSFYILITFLTVCTFTACTPANETPKSTPTSKVTKASGNKEGAKTAPTVNTIEATYGVDVNSYPDLVGAADYVFVGEVKEELATAYQATSGPTTIPYSRYMVQVTENLKGQLDMAKPIQIKKHGGLSEDQQIYHLLENDLLPEVGKSYIFVIYAQADGTNLASGANSTIPLEDSNSAISTRSTEAIEIFTSSEEEIIATFRDACQHQVLLPEGEQSIYHSADEVSP
ncbi:MAG: cell surface protein [Eubacteriales bacterium]|nr:cell surface protein [Eubacteriales bacterium]